jgi:hypothetical protein
MHAAGFEAGWDAKALMLRHRAVMAREHRGRGREVLRRDWTDAHHERGPKIWGSHKAWDHVEQRYGRYPTVVTAVVAKRAQIDDIEGIVQEPKRHEEEIAYMNAPIKAG